MWENVEAGDWFGDVTRAWVQDDEGLFQGKDSKGGGEWAVNRYDISRLGSWVATTSLIKHGKLTICLSWKTEKKTEKELNSYKPTNTGRMREKRGKQVLEDEKVTEEW